MNTSKATCFRNSSDLVTLLAVHHFSDGEWDLPSEQWRAPELLAWLFNDSKVAQRVVVNDRWGAARPPSARRVLHHRIRRGVARATHAWEENRRTGHPMASTANEDLADYASGSRLLLTLIDTVSRGGTRCSMSVRLRTGAFGIMQDSGLFLGAWLKHNGEAIYGTRTFATVRSGQPGEGRKWIHPLTTVPGMRRDPHAAPPPWRGAQGNLFTQGRYGSTRSRPDIRRHSSPRATCASARQARVFARLTTHRYAWRQFPGMSHSPPVIADGNTSMGPWRPGSMGHRYRRHLSNSSAIEFNRGPPRA